MARTGRSGSGRFKRALQTVHLWLGLLLAIPIIIIGLSGSGLLLQRELLAFSVPSATADGEHAPLVEVIAAAEKAAPENATARSVILPPYAGFPTTVNFDTSGRPPRHQVHIDPVSLEVLNLSTAVVNRGPILDVLIRSHAFLMLPAPIGFPIVGWMAVVMTFMAVSGIILWWPRKGLWKHAFWVRKGARGLRFHVEFHHAVGFWGSLILFVMGVSGIYLVYPETFRESVEVVMPTGNSFNPDREYAGGPAPLHADGAVAAALAAVPGTRPINIQLPPDEDLPFVVHLETTEFRPKLPPILVTLNARSGEINFVDDPRNYSIGDKFLNLQHALHFGIGLGWLWKILVFVSGILPLALAITGLMIYVKRRAAKRPLAEAEGAVSQPAE